MSSRKPFGVVGATMLGIMALLGTNAANAILDLDEDTGGVTYAKETLTGIGSVTVAGETYYMVSGTGRHIGCDGRNRLRWDSRFDAGYQIHIWWHGADWYERPGAYWLLAPLGDIVTRGGGQEGDSHVSFLVTRGGTTTANGGLTADTVARLSLETLPCRQTLAGRS